MCLFSFFVGFFDATTAEILAIHRACQLIVDNQSLFGRSITILSDSNSVVSWCNGEDFGNLSLVNFVLDIRQLLLSWDGLQIKYSPRGSNSFADRLAKMGSNGGGDRIEWGDIG